MTEQQCLFWGLLLFFYVFFHIKDNWKDIKYKHTDKKLIKKAKKHRAKHRKNILKKRKGKGK